MFNLKQDNFQGFLEKSKSETVISAAYGTEFVYSICLFYCVLFSMPFCTLFIFIDVKRFKFLPDLRSDVA